ncbi:AraC family transcriptional regulator [Salinicola acroporae]|uniref:AraC family transcriptional regulator n=1 Tax=Salinicola acroporae TaxID=1541440 RepID=A0ABT6I341_9GAMM|nr:AraC family transcriptional regulator [Salinicola acroporae]MDH4571829.1 AraC family transcriptional regulator [Salinicola acroporae]
MKPSISQSSSPRSGSPDRRSADAPSAESRVPDTPTVGQPPPRKSSEWINALLLGMRLSGLSYRRVQMRAPFAIAFDTDATCAQFHFIAQGSAILRIGDDVQRLESGDAVLLPRGGHHCLLSSPEVESRDIEQIDAIPLCDSFSCIDDGSARLEHGQGVRLFSGCMQFDLGGMQPLISMMPAVMHVGTLLSRYPEVLPMLEAMEREASLSRAGAAGILSRLADVVAASIVRGWVECGCAEIGGWVEALRDPRLGKVIAAVHRQPGRHWSVADMAAEMGSSRSAFAERFRTALGVSPLGYVTQLRMRLATQWIREKRLSIDQVAWQLGYGSQAAFSRAFKRATGQTPGEARGG